MKSRALAWTSHGRDADISWKIPEKNINYLLYFYGTVILW